MKSKVLESLLLPSAGENTNMQLLQMGSELLWQQTWMF